MLKTLWVNYWPYLLISAIMLLACWSNHKHNQDAARKGENPRHFIISFGRSSFRKEPEQPYTDDRKINRNWEL